MTRKYFTFKREYYDAILELSDTDQLEVFDAIMRLVFEGKETKPATPFAQIVFNFLLPKLRAALAHAECGRLGGAPAGNQNARKNNQKTTKKQPNDNQNSTKLGEENNVVAEVVFEGDQNCKVESGDNETINPAKNNQNSTKIQPKNNQKTTKIQPNDNQNDTPENCEDSIIIINNNAITGEKPAENNDEPVKNNDEPHNNKGRIFDSTKNNNNINNLNNNIIPEIIKLYNNICAKEKKLPSLLAISDKRRAKLRLRWHEWATMQDVGATPLDVFTAICEKMVATPFCTGENNRGWRASFDFIIENDSNYVKILEGRYDTQKQQTTDYGSRHLNERAAEQQFWQQQHELARSIVAGGGNPATFPDDGAF